MSITELNNKILKYSKHEKENFKNGKVRIAENKQDVVNFVKEAKKNASNTKLYFGKIGTEIANRISKDLNININNYNISLKTDSIRYILNHHGKKTELLRGQLPIKSKDFELIPKIVSDYDKAIKTGVSKQNKASITLTKIIENKYYLINYISDKNKNLEIQTMYKLKLKKNSVTESDAKSPD